MCTVKTSGSWSNWLPKWVPDIPLRAFPWGPGRRSVPNASPTFYLDRALFLI